MQGGGQFLLKKGIPTFCIKEGGRLRFPSFYKIFRSRNCSGGLNLKLLSLHANSA